MKQRLTEWDDLMFIESEGQKGGMKRMGERRHWKENPWKRATANWKNELTTSGSRTHSQQDEWKEEQA